MLEPSWVGRRVVIRRAVGTENGRRFTDSVGDLMALEGDTAHVATRHGNLRIPLESVTVARIAAPSAADILALEARCARGWRAESVAECRGWLLRANGGFTGRANTALPLRPPACSLDDTLDAARAWYAERGLPLGVHVPLPPRRLLDAELTARGWAAGPDVHVLAARLDMVRTGPDGVSPDGASPDRAGRDSAGSETEGSDRAGRDDAALDSAARGRAGPDSVGGVELAVAPDAAWLGRYRDGTTPALAREILVRHDRVAFAELRRDGRTVAIGRGAVDDGWLGVTAVEVAPEWRRRGLATSIMAALFAWARDTHAATHSYLQVTADNEAALTLYERLGYWRHHVYRYLTEPAEHRPSR